jgi:hypothetical protein
MTGPWRGVIWVLGCLALLAAAVESASYIANYRAAAEAVRLLRDVRTLEVGRTTGKQVQQLVRTYGGDVGQRFWPVECGSVSPQRRAYAVDIQSKLLNRIGEYDRLHDTGFRQFGATQWWVDASFGIDSRGYLSCIDVYFRSEPAHSESLHLDATYHLPYSPSDMMAYRVGYRGVHYVQSFGASATTNATPEQKRHAFDFDLSCLKRIGGCRLACRVMPLAWGDYEREARHQKAPLAPDQLRELNDPHCENLR